MQKKSQVTIFIIIGLLIIIMFSLFLSFRADFSVDEGKDNVPTQQVQVYLDSFVGELAEGSIIDVGRRGGEYSPDDYIEYTNYGIPVAYGIKDGQVDFERSSFERELCDYILESFPDEMDLSFLEVHGFNYSLQEGKCSASIEQGSVFFDINYPINISGEGVSHRVEDYEKIVEVKLDELFDTTDDLLHEINNKINADDEINLSNYDFSCSMTRACYYGGGIIEFIHYESWQGNPSTKLNIAVEDNNGNIIEDECTKLFEGEGSDLEQGQC